MKDLPPGWQVAKLGEVARWGSGGTPTAGDPRYYGGDIPWAVIGDLNDGLVNDTASRITDVGLRESSAKLVPSGAVLIAMYGSIGKLGIAGQEMATNQAIAFAVPNDAILEPRFLFLYLMSQRPSLAGAGKGMTQQNIGQETLKAWPIPLPPIEEQRRIVDILQDHLSRVQAAEGLLRSAENRGRTLMRKVLEATVAHEPVPGELATTIGEVAEVISGPAFKSSQFGSEGEGVRLLRGDNIEPGSLRWARTRTWPDTLMAGYEHLHIEADDLILAMDRPVISTGLKLARATEADLPALLVQRVARIRVGPTIKSAYLHRVLQSPRFLQHLQLDQVGTQIPHITLAGIRSFSFVLPTLSDQTDLLNHVDRLMSIEGAAMRTVRSTHGRATSLRLALLGSAFSGQLIHEPGLGEAPVA